MLVGLYLAQQAERPPTLVKCLDLQALVGSDGLQILQACRLLFQESQGAVKMGAALNVGKYRLGSLTGAFCASMGQTLT